MNSGTALGLFFFLLGLAILSPPFTRMYWRLRDGFFEVAPRSKRLPGAFLWNDLGLRVVQLLVGGVFVAVGVLGALDLVHYSS